MKEFIQKNGDEVAIVIYDAPLPPKYFRLTKRFIKTLFVVVPVVLVASFLLIFSWGLGSRIKHVPTPTLPEVLPAEDSKVAELQAEIKSLQESNNQLAEKLSGQPATATPEDPYLMAIKKPYGMQNLLSQNKVNLDQFSMVQEAGKVSFKFVIMSASPETKVTGHVLVFMMSENGLMAYPERANALITQGIKYSTGEPFSVSRLRPTNAEFRTQLTGQSVKFVIYIFNREGDLLLIRETESFKVGAKS
ncbi:hypothetical protein [Peredibacter starrii]|uniref:Uncharacterized protein n=1 Tax=Peredibacter starrii TaxID=28202 RepID=A0AAX4HSN4_9BACT|nr:hypothetical protein [Peredibacter starrii]WPU66221.1 hypothetical protein SOO65_05630 [Peredibacter starrii]